MAVSISRARGICRQCGNSSHLSQGETQAGPGSVWPHYSGCINLDCFFGETAMVLSCFTMVVCIIRGSFFSSWGVETVSYITFMHILMPGLAGVGGIKTNVTNLIFQAFISSS